MYQLRAPLPLSRTRWIMRADELPFRLNPDSRRRRDWRRADRTGDCAGAERSRRERHRRRSGAKPGGRLHGCGRDAGRGRSGQSSRTSRALSTERRTLSCVSSPAGSALRDRGSLPDQTPRFNTCEDGSTLAAGGTLARPSAIGGGRARAVAATSIRLLEHTQIAAIEQDGRGAKIQLSERPGHRRGRCRLRSRCVDFRGNGCAGRRPNLRHTLQGTDAARAPAVSRSTRFIAASESTSARARAVRRQAPR